MLYAYKALSWARSCWLQVLLRSNRGDIASTRAMIAARSFPSLAVRAGAAGAAARLSSSANGKKVGFIGLGKMGAGMVQNLADAGHKLVVYDVNPATTAAVAESVGAEPASSPADVVRKLGNSAAVISMVPNDKALWAVVKGEVIQRGIGWAFSVLLAESSTKPRSHTNHDPTYPAVTARHLPFTAAHHPPPAFCPQGGIFEATAKGSGLLHISCSTVSPFTSRALSDECEAVGVVHVSAPAFARPDGIAKRQAYFPVSGGDTVARSASIELIGTTSPETFDFGDDPGAANVVKLAGNTRCPHADRTSLIRALLPLPPRLSPRPMSCLASQLTAPHVTGNYLIASSIQSIAEAMALAEKNGLDRVQVGRV